MMLMKNQERVICVTHETTGCCSRNCIDAILILILLVILIIGFTCSGICRFPGKS